MTDNGNAPMDVTAMQAEAVVKAAQAWMWSYAGSKKRMTQEEWRLHGAMTDTDLIAEARREWPERMFEGNLINQLADALDARNAEVAALREVIEKAKADAWDEGFAAADINRPRSRKGHWEDAARGIRTWVPDPLPVNPYVPAVASPETEESK